jgi:hypothetical protein
VLESNKGEGREGHKRCERFRLKEKKRLECNRLELAEACTLV